MNRKLLIIVFIFAFILFGCNNNVNNVNNVNNINIDNNYITINITDEYNKYPVQVPVGGNVHVDLNGDGTAENISYILSKIENQYKQDVILFKINNKEYKNILYEDFGYYFSYPNSQWYYIVDIDETDKFKEIAILDEGPSADPCTFFFRYDKQNLYCIGSTTGFPHHATYIFNGDGTIISDCRLNILQTWTASFIWKLDENGLLTMVNSNLYYPYEFYNSNSQNLLKDFLVYKKPQLDSEQILIPAGSKITLVSTDNEHWVNLITDDGVEGWFYMEDYTNILIDGKQVDSKLIFDNLNFAG